MCFCAGASFTASIILSLIGIMSLSQVRKRSYYLFAATPLFFALQQAAEGVLWVALTKSSTLTARALAYVSLIDEHPSIKLMTYTFLFFALIIWPLVIPLSLALISRQKLLYQLTAFGAIISTLFATSLLWYGAQAAIVEDHIVYSFFTPMASMQWLLVLLYMLPAVGSFFLMRDKLFYLMGTVLFASAALSAFVWTVWFTSVWCFFAALLSVGVYFVVVKRS